MFGIKSGTTFCTTVRTLGFTLSNQESLQISVNRIIGAKYRNITDCKDSS